MLHGEAGLVNPGENFLGNFCCFVASFHPVDLAPRQAKWLFSVTRMVGVAALRATFGYFLAQVQPNRRDAGSRRSPFPR